MVTSVFVSYRRDDTKHAAGRLAERLEEHFELFMDIGIQPGADFTKALPKAVERADVLLALIGPTWLTPNDEQGVGRLHEHVDWVVVEIGAALERGTLVIPVLVDGARMPSRDELPASIADLADRHAARLTHEQFTDDCTRLIKSIKRAVSREDGRPLLSWLEAAGAWVDAHRTAVLVGGAVALVVLVSIVAAQLATGEDENNDPVVTPSPTPSEETDNAVVPLPSSADLPESQLLVAAGDDLASSNIWLVDAANPDNNKNLSGGTTREWLPVLSPDRRTMVFSKAKDDGDDDANEYVLWTAGAADFADARPLFGDNLPRECEKSAGRPAWLPNGQLVLRCFDEANEPRLLRVETDGEVRQVYDVQVDDVAIPSFGDPTASADGRAVVMWGFFPANDEEDVQGGSLYTLDVESGEVSLLRDGEGQQRYSDPVFSSDGSALAFRDDPPGDTGFEVAVAQYSESGLGDLRTLTTADGQDQDPAFSPGDEQIVYGHVPPGRGREEQELWVVPTDGSVAPRALFGVGDLPDHASVPAWSRR